MLIQAEFGGASLPSELVASAIRGESAVVRPVKELLGHLSARDPGRAPWAGGAISRVVRDHHHLSGVLPCERSISVCPGWVSGSLVGCLTGGGL